MCGEQACRTFRRRSRMGSSPRVRGTDIVRASCLLIGRIIPACAGNSAYAASRLNKARDHPRVCGEQCLTGCRRWGLQGSSPRVRGTAVVGVPKTAQSRIIPACAGNSDRETLAQLIAEDHPRVCGEQFPILFLKYFLLGSSPRVRGTALTRS